MSDSERKIFVGAAHPGALSEAAQNVSQSEWEIYPNDYEVPVSEQNERPDGIILSGGILGRCVLSVAVSFAKKGIPVIIDMSTGVWVTEEQKATPEDVLQCLKRREEIAEITGEDPSFTGFISVT